MATQRKYGKRGIVAFDIHCLAHPPKHSVVCVGNDATGQYLSSHYVKALEAEGQQVDLVKYPPDTTDFSPLLTRIKGLNPDIVHFWYNGDSTLTAFPQALKLDIAPAYFLFGVDPGIYQQRQAEVRQTGNDELRTGLLGFIPLSGGAGLF